MSLLGLVRNFVPEDNTRYHGMLYYLRKEENLMEIHFVIIKDLESHVMVS